MSEENLFMEWLDLRGVGLKDVTLVKGGRISGSRLSGCHLQNVESPSFPISYSRIDESTFRNINFHNAPSTARRGTPDVIDVRICKTKIRDSAIGNVKFKSLTLMNSLGENTTFSYMNFTQSRFFEVDFRDCHFIGCRFYGGNINHVNFTGCTFEESPFIRTSLLRVGFEGSLLPSPPDNAATFPKQFYGTYMITGPK